MAVLEFWGARGWAAGRCLERLELMGEGTGGWRKSRCLRARRVGRARPRLYFPFALLALFSFFCLIFIFPYFRQCKGAEYRVAPV